MSSQQYPRNHSYSSTSSYHSHVYTSQASQALYSNAWMTVIPIEDDDLTFGGKPLSDWYEEDRRRASSESSDAPSDQEVRGRTRQRAATTYESAPASHHHHHGHHGHHGHHKHVGHKHHHKKSDKK